MKKQLEDLTGENGTLAAETRRLGSENLRLQERMQALGDTSSQQVSRLEHEVSVHKDTIEELNR